jgi:hypothetical protein
VYKYNTYIKLNTCIHVQREWKKQKKKKKFYPSSSFILIIMIFNYLSELFFFSFFYNIHNTKYSIEHINRISSLVRSFFFAPLRIQQHTYFTVCAFILYLKRIVFISPDFNSTRINISIICTHFGALFSPLVKSKLCIKSSELLC